MASNARPLVVEARQRELREPRRPWGAPPPPAERQFQKLRALRERYTTYRNAITKKEASQKNDPKMTVPKQSVPKRNERLDPSTVQYPRAAVPSNAGLQRIILDSRRTLTSSEPNVSKDIILRRKRGHAHSDMVDGNLEKLFEAELNDATRRRRQRSDSSKCDDLKLLGWMHNTEEGHFLGQISDEDDDEDRGRTWTTPSLCEEGSDTLEHSATTKRESRVVDTSTLTLAKKMPEVLEADNGTVYRQDVTVGESLEEMGEGLVTEDLPEVPSKDRLEVEALTLSGTAFDGLVATRLHASSGVREGNTPTTRQELRGRQVNKPRQSQQMTEPPKPQNDTDRQHQPEEIKRRNFENGALISAIDIQQQAPIRKEEAMPQGKSQQGINSQTKLNERQQNLAEIKGQSTSAKQLRNLVRKRETMPPGKNKHGIDIQTKLVEMQQSLAVMQEKISSVEERNGNNRETAANFQNKQNEINEEVKSVLSEDRKQISQLQSFFQEIQIRFQQYHDRTGSQINELGDRLGSLRDDVRTIDNVRTREDPTIEQLKSDGKGLDEGRKKQDLTIQKLQKSLEEAVDKEKKKDSTIQNLRSNLEKAKAQGKMQDSTIQRLQKGRDEAETKEGKRDSTIQKLQNDLREVENQRRIQELVIVQNSNSKTEQLVAEKKRCINDFQKYRSEVEKKEEERSKKARKLKKYLSEIKRLEGQKVARRLFSHEEEKISKKEETQEELCELGVDAENNGLKMSEPSKMEDSSVERDPQTVTANASISANPDQVPEISMLLDVSGELKENPHPEQNCPRTLERVMSEPRGEPSATATPTTRGRVVSQEVEETPWRTKNSRGDDDVEGTLNSSTPTRIFENGDRLPAMTTHTEQIPQIRNDPSHTSANGALSGQTLSFTIPASLQIKKPPAPQIYQTPQQLQNSMPSPTLDNPPKNRFENSENRNNSLEDTCRELSSIETSESEFPRTEQSLGDISDASNSRQTKIKRTAITQAKMTGISKHRPGPHETEAIGTPQPTENSNARGFQAKERLTRTSTTESQIRAAISEETQSEPTPREVEARSSRAPCPGTQTAHTPANPSAENEGDMDEGAAAGLLLPKLGGPSTVGQQTATGSNLPMSSAQATTEEQPELSTQNPDGLEPTSNNTGTKNGTHEALRDTAQENSNAPVESAMTTSADEVTLTRQQKRYAKKKAKAKEKKRAMRESQGSGEGTATATSPAADGIDNALRQRIRAHAKELRQLFDKSTCSSREEGLSAAVAIHHRAWSLRSGYSRLTAVYSCLDQEAKAVGVELLSPVVHWEFAVSCALLLGQSESGTILLKSHVQPDDWKTIAALEKQLSVYIHRINPCFYSYVEFFEDLSRSKSPIVWYWLVRRSITLVQNRLDHLTQFGNPEAQISENPAHQITRFLLSIVLRTDKDWTGYSTANWCTDHLKASEEDKPGLLENILREFFFADAPFSSRFRAAEYLKTVSQPVILDAVRLIQDFPLIPNCSSPKELLFAEVTSQFDVLIGAYRQYFPAPGDY